MPLVTKTFSDIITFTRTSGATYFDSNGVLQTAGNNVPRLDYNPTTLAAQGLLIEEQRTNSIRNNTMQGAVAGTPGTLPTNWATVGVGLAFNVVGLGTEAGLPYIDIQVVGTTGGTSSGIRFDTNTGIAAVAGQTWTSSAYARMVAGSTTNISAVSINCSFLDAVAGIINSTSVSFTSTISQPSLTLARRTAENVVAGVGTLYARSQIIIAYASGVAIDITLRIGLPQLELGAFATSVIPTTTTALTRNADDARVNVLSPWYNQSAGTLFVERIQQPIDTISARRYINVCDGTTANSIQKYQSTGGISAAVTAVGGVASFGPSPAGVPAQGSIVKTALSFDGISKSMCRDAGTVFTDAIAPPTSGMTTMFIGSQLGTAGPAVQFSCTWIRRITYYPRRLSNAELQAITA